MPFADKALVCRDCGRGFTFTAGEQEFYQSRGLQNEPSRCPDCRTARRRSSPGSSQRSPREMYSVTCASCGVETQVPFQPRNDRPVYCSDCFAKMKNRS